MTRARLYYEAHVTIDPVPEEERLRVQLVGNPWGFKLAKLLMQKGQPSNLDTFMTAHDMELESIKHRVANMVRDLQAAGYNVRRYKIEDTVLDSRNEDELSLLTPRPAATVSDTQALAVPAWWSRA